MHQPAVARPAADGGGQALLGRPLRQQQGAGHTRRGKTGGHAGYRSGPGPEYRAALLRGAAVFPRRRRRLPAAGLPGLGDPAVRSLFPLPGHHLGTTGDPGAAAGTGAGHSGGPGLHGHAPAVAVPAPARPQPAAGNGAAAGHGRFPCPPQRERLPIRLPGDGTRRRRHTRFPAGHLSHGRRPSLPHRPVRYGDRQHPGV